MKKTINIFCLSIFLLAFTACSQTVTEPTSETKINTEVIPLETEVEPKAETKIETKPNVETEPESKPTTEATTEVKTNTNQSMVTLKTNHGDIKIKLYIDKTPKTVKNFYELSKTGKYDGSIFHRVIDGFMIQGGDYENSNGTGGTSIYGAEFEDEFVDGLSNVRGAISMANAGPGTNGSQFFIVHKDAVFLDGKHTVFGHVVEGMDVVDKIATIKTGLYDTPVEKVEIIKAIAQ